MQLTRVTLLSLQSYQYKLPKKIWHRCFWIFPIHEAFCMEHSDLHPHCAFHCYPRAASAWSAIFTLRETARHDDWKDKPHTTSILGPITLITLLCEFISIIQTQCTLWGHKVRLRVNSNLAECSAHSQFVATQVSLCWGSSAPQTRKSPCSNSSLPQL